MKCDELKPITVTDECGSYRFYNKSDVDAEITKLKCEINHNFGEFLHKIFHKNNNSTAQ